MRLVIALDVTGLDPLQVDPQVVADALLGKDKFRFFYPEGRFRLLGAEWASNRGSAHELIDDDEEE
jgi:hypothetical protein